MATAAQLGGFALSLPHHPEARLRHIAHGVDPFPQGGVDWMGAALRGADLGMAEEEADQFK